MLSSAVLGLTVGCARCHNHKFDPLLTKEFYEFYAFFHNVPEKGLDRIRTDNPPPRLPSPTPEQAMRFVEADFRLRDDEPTTRYLTRVALEQAGFSVVEVGDGAAVLAACARTLPDLLLLDVDMPEIDGISVCKCLRERSDARHVPIVMATGLDDFASIDAAFAAGATDFIPKPINWALLRHRVRYILRSSQAAMFLCVAATSKPNSSGG